MQVDDYGLFYSNDGKEDNPNLTTKTGSETLPDSKESGATLRPLPTAAPVPEKPQNPNLSEKPSVLPEGKIFGLKKNTALLIAGAIVLVLLLRK